MRSLGCSFALTFAMLLAASTALSAAPSPCIAGPADASSPTGTATTEGGPAVGQRAPDFDVATSYGWRRFSGYWPGGTTVLVFGVDDATLAEIERESARLGENETSIFAVRSASDGANWDTLHRLGLRFAMISDPSGHVASLYGMALERGHPAWVAIDREGIVRRCERAVPGTSMAVAIADHAAAGRALADGDAGR